MPNHSAIYRWGVVGNCCKYWTEGTVADYFSERARRICMYISKHLKCPSGGVVGTIDHVPIKKWIYHVIGRLRD